MWVLECEGELFDHKRLWLRPGKSYLFGRTKPRAEEANPNQQLYKITDNSVSRKHLVISVTSVKAGDATKTHVRTSVTLTDQSKQGTYLDDEKFSNSSRDLSEKEHVFKLGAYSSTFKISWRPVVLTFTFTAKQEQKNDDVLRPFRDQLEPIGIKTINSYVVDATTHVISSKRNVPKCLQALINAKYIVEESFIKAVITATQSPGLDEDGSTALPCPLELDMQGNWPDAMSFLPPPNKEPVSRPVEAFIPNFERIHIFEGFTFVFADLTQHEMLQAPITNGGGKSVCFDMQLGQTSLQEFIKFVKNTADDKGLGDLLDDGQGRGVVVVRFRGKGDTAEWVIDFIRKLDQKLGVRSVEQNEFLDAILINDASGLRRALDVEDTQDIALPSSKNVSKAIQKPTTAHVQPKQPPTSDPVQPEVDGEQNRASPPVQQRIRRTITQRRFKGFDDFDDDDDPLDRPIKRRITSSSPEPIPKPHTQRSVEMDSQPLFISDSQSVIEDPVPTSTVTSKKRSRPVLDSESEGEDMLAKLLPAQTEMQSRRLAQDSTSAVQLRATSRQPSTAPTAVGSSRPAKKAKKETNAKPVARTTRQATAISTPVNQEPEDIDLVEIRNLRNLAIVEEMNVVPRTDKAARHGISNETGDRWDESWNGRKNFKRFRRKGEPLIRQNKVIVALEEVRKKDFGVGDQYWLDREEEPRPRSRGKGRVSGISTDRSQSQSQSRSFMRRREDSVEEDIPEALPDSNEERTRNAINVEASNDSVGLGRRQGKRPAESRMDPIPKRQRQTRLMTTREEDSDDEDELRFKPRRRK